MRIRERFNPHAPFEARRGGRLAPASNDRFNPRTPCGARRRSRTASATTGRISTHAPLAGRDVHLSALIRSAFWISTHAPLAGRDVDAGGVEGRTINISTHAPLAGRDRYQQQDQRARQYFNPRAPCGARHDDSTTEKPWTDKFQPTRPLRGATFRALWYKFGYSISTHAPLAGRDRVGGGGYGERWDFNPRAPCGARRDGAGYACRGRDFNPRAPCGARRSRRP